MNVAADASPGDIEIKDLTLSVHGLPLLRNASALCPQGKVTLIVGPSGSGKTVLLRVLAGLIRRGAPGFVVEGSVRAGGIELLSSSSPFATRPVPIGIVFQDFALFDELTAAENLEFARDHRPRANTPTRTDRGRGFARALLEEFGLPLETPVSALSGGQKQRLAIARTLAYDPPVILYDEPTSGLDPAAARRVAERIRSTGESHGKTTIVVTHDYLNLAPVADEVLLLDHQQKTLRKIEPGELKSLGQTSAAVPTVLPRQESRPGATRRLWRQATGVLETTGGALLGALLVFLFLVPVWRSLRWALRYLWHYFWLLASPSSCLYFAASGLIAGFVSTHFTFKFLPHRQYTEPLLSDELLNGLGFATYRIMVPILLTILVAARCGAAVASDVGGRVYAHQVDAMRSMGVSPERYLLTNILYAFLLATPLLIGLGFLAAKLMSMTVFVYNHPELGAHYWDGHYHRDLRIPGQLFYLGSEWLIAKLLVCGMGVGAIAYFIGRRPKGSGVEVSRGITATIIGATLYVLVVHFVFAFVEF